MSSTTEANEGARENYLSEENEGVDEDDNNISGKKADALQDNLQV